MSRETLVNPDYWKFIGSKPTSRRTLLRSTATLGLGFAGAALFGCNSQEQNPQATAQKPKQPGNSPKPDSQNQARLISSKEGPGEKNPEIPSVFKVKNLEGGDVRLDLGEYRGKPLILAFYNTHMSNVFNAAQIIEGILPKIPQDSVQIIGIAHFSTPSEVQRSIQSTRNGTPYPFPVYADPDRTTKKFLDLNFIQGFPAFVVINSQGEIAKKFIGNGAEEKQALIDTIKNLIQSK